MFYSQFILAKKGPLGTIWIAAHLERKLRKNQVADTDIGISVDSILFPEVPIALRLSSHLLLGVVRIYSRKVNYLFDDCSEALLKIKQAFRSTAVDLPPEESTAPYHSITLPETFDLDDFELPDNEIFQGNYVDHHVSAREQITLQDTMDGVVYSTSQFGLDERFGDGDTSQVNFDLDEEVFQGKDAAAEGEGVSGADHDAFDDAPTPLVKDAATPGASEPMLVDGSANQVDDRAANSEFNEYAQAPQTPGLVEVTNLSVARMACDDHMEVDDHNVLGLGPAEELRNTCNEFDILQKCISVKESSFENDLCRDSAINAPPDETGDLEKQNKPGESDSLVNEKTDTQCDPESTLPGAATSSVDRTDGERVESPCCSHVTTELEDPGQASALPEMHNDSGMTDKSKESAPDAAPLPESPGRPTVVDAENPAFQERKDPGASTEKQGDECHANDANQETDSALHGENQTDCRRLDEQPDNQIENLTGSVCFDLPPEKLLSVPEGLSDKDNEFLAESTPHKVNLGMDKGTDAGNKNISGKKRSFTESTLTVESLNSVESVGLICSRRTADTIPDDDDLLSSILVGRSSFLKMKQTPVLEVASPKRSRGAPRSTASKRKVLVDDPMVLHGDIIRQQLINTEDIRRVRKKAPCTRPEILMIHRQFLEDELFKEPIFSGMSVELVSLHSEPYDLNGIRIMKSEEYRASTGVEKEVECSVRPNAIEESRMEGSTASIAFNEEQEQPAHTSIHPENHQNKGQDAQGQAKAISGEDSLEPLDNEFLGEKSEMEVDKGDAGGADEDGRSMAHGEICEIPIGEKNGIEENLEMEALYNNNDEKTDEQVVDVSHQSGTDPIEIVEGDVGNIVPVEMDMKAEDELLPEEAKVDAAFELSEVQTDLSAPNESLAAVLKEAGSSNNLVVGSGDEIREADNDGVQVAELGSDDKNQESNGDFNEEARRGSEADAGMKSVFPTDGESPTFKELDMRSRTGAGLTSQDAGGNDAETENMEVAHDTEFLNVDDDEVAEDDEDGMPYGDQTRLLENTGWSSRTRAVAKYLQTLFDKEAEHAERGKKVLPVDNLLAGKTRKEASRMFFETLVLKTKDYIHVEQVQPFDNINIKPRAKLMKSVF